MSDLLDRRARLLGPAYRLFYAEPLELVRGAGTLLFDAAGRDYLDAYNNVPVVGHGNQRVAAAVAEQMGRLSTHTRYLDRAILDYAEDLLASFGGEIAASGHLILTCTGSEANDLALRLAQHRTGRRGILISDHAYHGNSAATAALSPSLGPNAPIAPWVRRILVGGDGPGAGIAVQVADAIADLERSGEGVAALIIDSVLSSDGIHPDPPGFLAPAAAAVRAAGGVIIADEVQAGFGRTGEAFWGYRRHGLDPDIVTLGKPMGNGYPVAGLAVRPDLVTGFGRDLRYFNTFGGNGAAIAAARTTLAVIREAGLQANALAIGRGLMAEIRDRARRQPRIGAVRGVGLYIGIDMISNDGTAPDPALATAVLNGMHRRGVLIGTTGPHGHTLKIRPPLVFSAGDGARLLAALDQTFADLGL